MYSFFQLLICVLFIFYFIFLREIAYIKRKKEENWLSFVLRGWFEAYSKPVPPSYIGHKHFTTQCTLPKTEGSKNLLGIVVVPMRDTKTQNVEKWPFFYSRSLVFTYLFIYLFTFWFCLLLLFLFGSCCWGTIEIILKTGQWKKSLVFKGNNN